MHGCWLLVSLKCRLCWVRRGFCACADVGELTQLLAAGLWAVDTASERREGPTGTSEPQEEGPQEMHQVRWRPREIRKLLK